MNLNQQPNHGSRRAAPVIHHERSLCRERFRDYDRSNYNRTSRISQKNPTLAAYPYPAFWLPNICEAA
jgi:hypothetical protein